MPKRQVSRIGDLESIFLRLEELVLANSGEDEFEEVFKLVIAKLWDEHSSSSSAAAGGGREGRFRAYPRSGEASEAIAALLREAQRAWPGVVEPGAVPLLTPEHLQVCVEALSAHSLLSSGLEVLDSFFEFMVARCAKGAKGQYFTPRHVVEFCVRMLRPQSDETVADPACGSGGFLVHALNYVRSSSSEGLTGDALRRYCATKLWGFDIDGRAIRVARALMVLSGDGRSNIMRVNSLQGAGPEQMSLVNSEPDGSVLTIEDVCRSRLRNFPGFDVILTNPPFAGEVREQHIIEQYVTSKGRTRVERDVLFVERCVQLLRPGGRMAIVLPHNKVGADSYGYLREWLLREVRVLAVVGLGRNTFLPHTHQKASILFAQKKRSGESTQPPRRIFFGVSERDGKNSRGQIVDLPGAAASSPLWERADHDLCELVEGFESFCVSEKITLGGLRHGSLDN